MVSHFLRRHLRGRLPRVYTVTVPGYAWEQYSTPDRRVLVVSWASSVTRACGRVPSDRLR
jgi:hypothetical protein